VAVIPLPEYLPRRSSRRVLTLLLLLCLGVVSWAVVGTMISPPISCQGRAGAFSNAFSVSFDINRVDCHIHRQHWSPTVHFWDVSPYVGIDW
jgi:hypothetical protein